MRIDLDHDRLDHSPDRYRDPVVARTGVFGRIERAELSEAEQARSTNIDERAAKAEAKPVKIWTPKAVLKRITNLYARFANPGGKA